VSAPGENPPQSDASHYPQLAPHLKLFTRGQPSPQSWAADVARRFLFSVSDFISPRPLSATGYVCAALRPLGQQQNREIFKFDTLGVGTQRSTKSSKPKGRESGTNTERAVSWRQGVNVGSSYGKGCKSPSPGPAQVIHSRFTVHHRGVLLWRRKARRYGRGTSAPQDRRRLCPRASVQTAPNAPSDVLAGREIADEDSVRKHLMLCKRRRRQNVGSAGHFLHNTNGPRPDHIRDHLSPRTSRPPPRNVELPGTTRSPVHQSASNVPSASKHAILPHMIYYSARSPAAAPFVPSTPPPSPSLSFCSWTNHS